MDPWMVFGIAFAIFMIIICFAICSSAVSKANKSEKVRQENENIRLDFFKREGMPVHARVVDVVIHEDQRQYEVFASWRSRETGRVYEFHDIYMFPRDADQGFNPQIGRGDTIMVWAILDQPSHFMEKNW